MQTPLRITFRHMEASPALEERIREHVVRLERFHRRITGCHVVVIAPAGRSQKGAPYDVRIEIMVPGREIVAHRESGGDAGHTDVYVALRDAFEAARRQLQDLENADWADTGVPESR